MQFYGRTGLADVLPWRSTWLSPTRPVRPSRSTAPAPRCGLDSVSIPTHGVALNMTVQSYQEGLDFGLTADRRAVPDVGRLADLLVDGG